MSEEINKHVKKTGTLTIGIVCKDGIVLFADNRVTYGGQGGISYLAGKTKKIFKLNDRILSTIAGTASDAVRSLRILAAEIRLKELKTKEEASIREAANLAANMLFQNIRTPSLIPSITHFLFVGYDSEGVHLYDISPDGYLKKIEDYQATGAPFQAHSILDADYRKGISMDEGIKLAIKAFKTTIGREPSVGDGFDIYTIKKGEIKQVLNQVVVPEIKDAE
jgi:proteasome beta subunit